MRVTYFNWQIWIRWDEVSFINEIKSNIPIESNDGIELNSTILNDWSFTSSITLINLNERNIETISVEAFQTFKQLKTLNLNQNKLEIYWNY